MSSSYIFLFNLFSFFLPGSATVVKRLLLVLAGCRCSKHIRFGHAVSVYGNSIFLGEDVWFSEGCLLSSGYSNEGVPLLKIGNRCDFGPRVLLCCGSHEIGSSYRRAGKGCLSPIYIGDGCWIGASAVIFGGVEVGAGCIVAAGAVLKPGKYPDNVLLAGNPAVVKRKYVS